MTTVKVGFVGGDTLLDKAIEGFSGSQVGPHTRPVN